MGTHLFKKLIGVHQLILWIIWLSPDHLVHAKSFDAHQLNNSVTINFLEIFLKRLRTNWISNTSINNVILSFILRLLKLFFIN